METLDQLLHPASPASVAIIAPEGAFDYAALDHLTARVAAGLVAAGAERGDRIASWIGKTLAAVVLPFACWRAGLVHVPINPALKAPQAEHILRDCGARMLISGRDRMATLEAVPGLTRLSIEDDWAGLTGAAPIAAPVAEPGDLAALLYTSGSTGRPKGVMLSHANLWLGADAVADYLELSSESRVLALLPFSFDYGLNQLLSTFRGGGTVVLHDYALPQYAVRAIGKYGVNTLAGVPPMWGQLLDVKWPDEARAGLRCLTNSGGHLSRTLIVRMRDLCPEARIFPMYGLTEAFRSTYLDPALIDTHADSIGQAIPHAEILVVRPDGAVTDAGEPGELVHCGPLVAGGYWNDPERSAERFRPAPGESVYGGMAVWSGDTVVRDAEGFLSFVGRSDEMIKTAGNRVSPTEIEEAALATGAVAECAAFGVADERLGQAIVLAAVPAGGLSAEDAEAQLAPMLRHALPNFMLPARIAWQRALPRNPNGKFDRVRLKAEILS